VSRSVVIVRLVIEGDASDAAYVVGEALDAGHLQDAINEHDCEAGPLRVVSATVE